MGSLGQAFFRVEQGERIQLKNFVKLTVSRA